MSAADRSRLAKLNTNPHSRNAGRPYSQSPSHSRNPPPDSSTRDGMSHRKRAPEPRSRGNSPPDKRSRLDNPAPSRQNSVSIDKRRTDPNAGGSKLSDSRRTSVQNSAFHIQSPGGNSGGSTPTHVAPPAPSMLPMRASSGTAPTSITLASLRSVKQKKEAIAKAAASQSGQAQVPIPQNDQLDDKLSAQSKALESLSAELDSLKIQMKQAPDYSKTLADFERRFIKLEYNKGIPSKLELLEKATKSHTAELATLAGLNATVEDVKQSKNVTDQDIKDIKTQLQQNQKELQNLTEILRDLNKGFHLLDDFKKHQEKLNSPARVGQVSREISDFKKEQAKLDITTKLENMYKGLEEIKTNEKETFERTRDIKHSIRRYIGLNDEDVPDFEKETLVQRVYRHDDMLRSLQKHQSERPKPPVNQEKSTAVTEKLDKLRSEQSGLSGKVSELTATLVRVSKLQDEQSKKLEMQEKLAPALEQIQRLENAQAELSAEHGKLSTKQGTQESRMKVLEDNNMTASSQLNATYTAQMRELKDNVQASKAKIDQVEQQLSTLGDQFSALPVEQINDDVQALIPRLAHVEQLSKKTNEYATTSQIKQVNDSLQALAPRTAQLEQQLSLKELPQKISNLPMQFRQTEERLQAFEHQKTRSDALATGLAVPSQVRDHADAAEVSSLRTQTVRLEASIQSLKNNVTIIDATVQNLSDEADEDRQSMGERLNEVFTTTGIIPSIKQLEQKVDALQQQQVSTPSMPDLTPLQEGTRQLRADLAQLQTMQADEAALRQQEMIDVKSQMATKATTASVDEALNNLRAVFRGFRDQYNNISTDELHSKMVHWFLQNYPSNPAQVVEQLTALQHEMRGLQTTSRDTAWMQSRIQDLDALLKMGPRLSALVQSANGIQHLLENTASFHAASKNAAEAKLQADKIQDLLGKDGLDVQSLPVAIRDVQQAVRGLQSDSASFITRRDIPQIKEDLGNEIKVHYTSISNRDRMDVETSVTRLTDCVQSLENPSPDLPVHLQEQFDKLTADIKESQEAQLLYPSLLKSIAELQSIIYDIHQNWPPDADSFDCVFKHDFRPKQPAQPQAKPKGGIANKGKARQF